MVRKLHEYITMKNNVVRTHQRFIVKKIVVTLINVFRKNALRYQPLQRKEDL